MASIKAQVEELENKIAEYQQSLDSQDIEDDLPVEEMDVVEVQETIETEPVVEQIEEPVEEPVEEVMEMEVMDIELDPVDDLPFYDDLPESVSETEESEPEVLEPGPVAEPEPVAAPVPVIDAMTAKQPWRTDMPGSPVRDIRSAISLNDRILFINYLFGEDPMAFQEMLTQLNAMTSFDEAAAHAIAAHPEWNLESDTVYRFMMALRRRHQ